MNAGIIAAGEGSRLKAEGISVPKPLVPVDGVPLLERLLRIYNRCGIDRVTCIINEYSLQVREYVESKDFGMPVHFIVKTTPSSMHSLFALAPYLKGDKFLLSTVDSIFSEDDLRGFLTAGGSSRNDGTLALTDFVDDEKPLYVTLDADMRIVRFGRKDGEPSPRWVTGGLYIFSPGIFTEMDLALGQGMERLRNFLALLVERGYRIAGHPFSRIVDVDHAGDIRTAEQLLRVNT